VNCVVAKKKTKRVAKQTRTAKARAVQVTKPKYIANAHLSTAKQKPISLYYPKPDEMDGKVRIEPPSIPPHVEPRCISFMHDMKTIGKKKALACAVTAVGAAAVLSGTIAFFFYYVMNIDNVFSLLIALMFFIGFSKLFYNFLELSERTDTQ